MHRKNNLDFLRFLFASFVIITHSYNLTGTSNSDLISRLTNGTFTFSSLGVYGFFVISGFLIFQSMLRSRNVAEYYWKRGLRLFPALVVVLLLTIVLGPFVYDSPTPYWKNKEVWTYVPKNLLLYKTQYSIAGLFETNPYKTVVNGSLWTIPYEFSMYVLISALFFVRKNKVATGGCLFAVFCFLLAVNLFDLDVVNRLRYQFFRGYQFSNLGTYFFAGALLAYFNAERLAAKQLNWLMFISSAVLIVTAVVAGKFLYVQYVFLPLAIISFGINSFKGINSIGGRIGDLSYGIYIYGFPVQQTLIYYFHLDYTRLILFSLPTTYLLAYFSWHLIESKALKFKNFRETHLSKRILLQTASVVNRRF